MANSDASRFPPPPPDHPLATSCTRERHGDRPDRSPVDRRPRRPGLSFVGAGSVRRRAQALGREPQAGIYFCNSTPMTRRRGCKWGLELHDCAHLVAATKIQPRFDEDSRRRPLDASPVPRAPGSVRRPAGGMLCRTINVAHLLPLKYSG